ncbi:protein deadpan-like [Hyalella azteca]|uniref:Protein deadpan-like n=1 Tax=Hyalella azteca TaxID=294128 RepID=A0A8B7N171_HYAAZ|nr:protein deadpan-like [Hyalella azteca]
MSSAIQEETVSESSKVLAFADSSVTMTADSGTDCRTDSRVKCEADLYGDEDKKREAIVKKMRSKPQTERRRRQRINECVALLKQLVLEAMGKDPSQYTKLEKADVLDMAVRYVQTLRQQQPGAVSSQEFKNSSSTSSSSQSFDSYVNGASFQPSTLSCSFAPKDSFISDSLGESLPENTPTSLQYRAGFSHCSSEIGIFLRMLKNIPHDLPDKVASHLNNLLMKIQTENEVSQFCSKDDTNQFTGLSPTIQPILLLLSPVPATIPTFQIVGQPQGSALISATNLTSFNSTFTVNSLVDSAQSRVDSSGASPNNSASWVPPQNEAIMNDSAACNSPCISIKSDQSSPSYLNSSDDTDLTLEEVPTRRSDESFSSGDSIESQLEKMHSVSLGAGSCSPITASFEQSTLDATERKSCGHCHGPVGTSVNLRMRDQLLCSSGSVQQQEAIKNFHSRDLQPEMSSMWRPWH